jgi:glycosylphosphatidylinositol transamidase (GPIT) subunit GPI8
VNPSGGPDTPVKPEPPTPPEPQTSRVIAIVAPGSLDARLKQTATWFLESRSSDLKYEWFDEEKENISSLGSTLSNRKDVLAVIGPFDNERMATLAQECKETLKPIIAPTVSSEEVIRRFCVKTAGQDKNLNHFFWPLSATDMNLTELLLSHYGVYQEEHKEYTRFAWPAFFAPDNIYGKTFTDWAPFYALQQDFPIKEYEVYENQDKLLGLLRDQMELIAKQGFFIHLSGFCVLESPGQLLAVARQRRGWMLSDPQMKEMFSFPSTDPSDKANDEFQPVFLDYYRSWYSLPDITEEDLAAMGDDIHLLEGYQCLSPYIDPDTGFLGKYEQKFGRKPSYAESKLCDALELVLAAVREMDSYKEWPANLSENERLNESIGAVTPLKAASGEISFDDESGMPTTSPTYLLWEVKGGKLNHLHYYRDGASEVMEDWKKHYDERNAIDDFDTQAGASSDGEYGPITGRYAVLVQGSNGFSNYRHAADVLGMYQLLRAGGIDDDHIILVLDKKIPTDSDNPSPGEIHLDVTGPDLYGGKEDLPAAVVDYDSADLTPQDIADILKGKASEKLHAVLPAGDGNNVLLYWSGHGHKAASGRDPEFAWRNLSAGSGFTSTMLRESVEAMTYRKLLVVAEPCYSEAVLTTLKDQLHALGISGASADEQSWADCRDYDHNFWMCDRFSRNVILYLEDHPEATYRDLFLYCSANTLGSHPKIIPGIAFGNLYVEGPKEFINNN